MKNKKVDCFDCIQFIMPQMEEFNNDFSGIKVNAKCKLKKRVMFRMPTSVNDIGGYIRFCDEYKLK